MKVIELVSLYVVQGWVSLLEVGPQTQQIELSSLEHLTVLLFSISYSSFIRGRSTIVTDIPTVIHAYLL